NHPHDVLKIGQSVKAQVLEVDTEKRRLKLGIKQLVPTSIEEYIAEHRQGGGVSGRALEILDGQARVELGEGIQGSCRTTVEATAPVLSEKATQTASKSDLSSLSSMLQARWKGGAVADPSKPEEVRPGQIRSFRVVRLDPATKNIELQVSVK